MFRGRGYTFCDEFTQWCRFLGQEARKNRCAFVASPRGFPPPSERQRNHTLSRILHLRVHSPRLTVKHTNKPPSHRPPSLVPRPPPNPIFLLFFASELMISPNRVGLGGGGGSGGGGQVRGEGIASLGNGIIRRFEEGLPPSVREEDDRRTDGRRPLAAIKYVFILHP